MSSPSPAKLIELATAYQRSKILFALIRFGVPTLLAGGPRSLGEIASDLGVDVLAAHRFLNACAELGLLIRVGDGFRNAPEAQRFLVRGAPDYLGDAFHRYERASVSDAWAQFDRSLRAWHSGGARGPLSTELAPTGDEIEGHHRLSLLTGNALGGALDLTGHRRLLDLGGGTGAMSIALCRRFPALEAIVLELPAITAQTRAHVRDSGLDRIAVREGDFVAEPLPEGSDVVLLANVLSMLDREAIRALLVRVYEHLAPGGRIVLSGWMLDDDKSGPLLPTLLSLEDITLGAPDVERSAEQYAGWLARAGFVDIERAMYFEPTSYVSGLKPAQMS